MILPSATQFHPQSPIPWRFRKPLNKPVLKKTRYKKNPNKPEIKNFGISCFLGRGIFLYPKRHKKMEAIPHLKMATLLLSKWEIVILEKGNAIAQNNTVKNPNRFTFAFIDIKFNPLLKIIFINHISFFIICKIHSFNRIDYYF